MYEGEKTFISLLPLCTHVNVYAYVLRCKSDCFSDHDAFLFSGQNVSTLFILLFFFTTFKIVFTNT